jgi:hypothetical protein
MTEPRKGYMVAGLEDSVSLDVGGTEINLPLSFAEGMIGALPVFDTEENAKAFASEGISIFSLILHENPDRIEDDNETNI